MSTVIKLRPELQADDEILVGAEAIGRVAGTVNRDGTVNLQKTRYGLRRGYIPATKRGRLWISTARKIREVFVDFEWKR